MSLLTEEQIADILDILCVCGTTTRARDLEQWNENQPPLPHATLLLDWSLAPKWADRATVSVTWDGIGLTDTIAYSITKRPDIKHHVGVQNENL